MEVRELPPFLPLMKLLSKDRSTNPENPDLDILLWKNFALQDLLRYYVNMIPNSPLNAVN